ncbi:MAG: LamG domain-containing protein, partial [archaeon]|nr:LamG domain-containing protein [archaeon]
MTRKPAYLAFLFSVVFLSASALSYDPFVLGTNSIVLDGLNDYITVLDDSSLALTNVTIAAWINVTPGSASTTILSKDSSYKLEIDTNGELKASLYAPSTWNSVTSTIALPSNEWIFITFTFTGSDLNLYVDGVLNQSVTPLSALSIASSTNDLYIGSAAGSSSFFNGSIDDLAVWDSALSQSDITTIYNSGSGISDLTQTYSTDLVGYWKFDEGSGNSASDSSGQGNDGTLSNEWMWADIYLSIGGHGVPTKAIPRLVSEDGA